jgi:hypothetical protein
MSSHLLPRTCLALASSLPMLASAVTAPAQGDLLYSVSTTDLRVIDALTGLTVSSTPIVVGSFTNGVARCMGLASHPVTGTLFLIVKEVETTSTTPRWLGTLDPSTGSASLIATLPDVFSGIAFRSDGTLFGITGAGAATPESLFTIDTDTGAQSLVASLAAGTNVYWDVGCITFAPDGFLYRMSGNGIQNVAEIMQRVDTLNGYTVTQVQMTYDDTDEMLCLTPYTGGNLLGADKDNDWYVITTAGRVSRIGQLDHFRMSGLTYLRSPNTQPFIRPYGDGCQHVTDRIPMLIGSGTPAPGNLTRFEVIHGPKQEIGGFVFGFGNVAQPFPSTRCQAQCTPLLPGAAIFVTNTLGRTAINIPIPTIILPCDLFLQAGINGFGEFVVTNPVQLHIL